MLISRRRSWRAAAVVGDEDAPHVGVHRTVVAHLHARAGVRRRAAAELRGRVARSSRPRFGSARSGASKLPVAPAARRRAPRPSIQYSRHSSSHCASTRHHTSSSPRRCVESCRWTSAFSAAIFACSPLCSRSHVAHAAARWSAAARRSPPPSRAPPHRRSAASRLTTGTQHARRLQRAPAPTPQIDAAVGRRRRRGSAAAARPEWRKRSSHGRVEHSARRRAGRRRATAPRRRRRAPPLPSARPARRAAPRASTRRGRRRRRRGQRAAPRRADQHAAPPA